MVKALLLRLKLPTLSLVISLGPAVCVAWAGAPPASTTFDYKSSKSYEELTNSIEQTKRKLDAAESTLGTSNTNVANLLNDLAGFYDDLGDYSKELPLLQRSLAIREKMLGAQNPEVADDLNDIGWAYLELDDYEQALVFFQRSLAMSESLLGAEDYGVATTLSNIADLYRRRGDYLQALLPAQRSLAIRLKSLGENHPDLVDSFMGLAAIFRGLGNHQEALNYCQRAQAIAGKALDPEHPLVADTLFVMGGIQADVGNFARALSAYQRALAIDTKISGAEHPDVLEVLTELASLFAKHGDFSQSLSVWVELFKRQRSYLVRQILSSSDREALRLLGHSFQATELFQSVCAEDSTLKKPEAVVIGAQELALSKGFLEATRAAQAAFEANPETATKELRDRYHALQAQLARLTQNDPQRESKRQALQTEVNQLEMDLAAKVSLVAQIIRERKLTLREIAESLPEQSALVDFVEYRRGDLTTYTNRWCERRYAAYVTFPKPKDSTNIIVERFDLGEAAPVDRGIELVIKRMSSGQYQTQDLQDGLAYLSLILYAPLSGQLEKVSHLIICPDGQLSRLPFEILSNRDRLLIEEKTISYVGSARDVASSQGGGGGKSPSASLVLGNPDFDLDITRGDPPRRPASPNASPATFAMTATRGLSHSFRAERFGPLPKTEDEARFIATSLGTNCVLRLGAEARETALKSVQSPTVLHLATHGFFLSDQDLVRGLKLGEWENPLVRCGIALAGANHALQLRDSPEDGLLTGQEAALLRLQGTELVILSACDTGTGEVEIGEGVMSLRRSFRIAGAETVLASHWPVSDRATPLLMEGFMRRWRSGEPRAKAWREAQLSLLRSKEFSSPYFWGAFTLMGQWR